MTQDDLVGKLFDLSLSGYSVKAIRPSQCGVRVLLDKVSPGTTNLDADVIEGIAKLFDFQ